jgi:hypothetical protein
MRVGVVGSRDLVVTPNDIINAIDGPFRLPDEEDTIVTGCCPTGADAAARALGEMSSLEVKVHKAQWSLHGRAAGPIRNTEIAADIDALVAFWDGKSRGTLDTISKVVRRGLPVFIEGRLV